MKYAASCSFGKDSLATVILAREHGEPLDEIVYVEVMFDSGTSGEVPEHRDFIYRTAIPRLESYGYKVTVLRSRWTYEDHFEHVITKGSRKGKKTGFPMAGKCAINRDCKFRVIEKWRKTQPEGLIQYIGITADEPKRLLRLKENQISLLAKYRYTETMAKELCEKHGLLSPAYEFTDRLGCWFCPNIRERELKHLRKHHPDLWERLLSMENGEDLAGPIWNVLKKTSLHSMEDKFYWEERQMSVFDFIKNEIRK